MPENTVVNGNKNKNTDIKRVKNVVLELKTIAYSK